MELSTRYTPAVTEERWYAHWERQGYFRSAPDGREPFTVVIPPPNVTGVLHMGHMLNNTIQDILIRKARLDGKNACWVPGTDHASIATEAKVVRWLREEKKLRKADITREQFIEYAWQWKEKYGGIILKQLRKLGASCDWERTAFTMDPGYYRDVMRVFVDLYNKGKLYRGLRMVNWDPEAKTVLSNEEVLYNEEQAQLFHIKYLLADAPPQPPQGGENSFALGGPNEAKTDGEIKEGSFVLNALNETKTSDALPPLGGQGGGGIVIATQRPETIFADVAVAVNPKDPRYKNLVGKKVLIPLINRAIPVIADDYVDIEFGTGALKITPAHDPNDYEVGQRHGLEVLDTISDDGKINDVCAYKPIVGLDRFEARKHMKPALEESGHLVKIEDYRTNIGRSERTGAVVEPKLSLQWFVKMSSLGEPALKAVLDEQIKFYPSNFQNLYRNWMENLRDWCISRQLWWGQRIPAWYYAPPSPPEGGGTGRALSSVNTDAQSEDALPPSVGLGGGEHVFVAETAAEALEIAKRTTGNQQLTINDLRQDEDVLDTWASSWLWPISVFDGFEKPDGEIKYYYPTSVLVTGWDIIFFWVARMIMAGYEYKGQRPFDAVYFTGMVRDKQRRKMSKSLGNSPDAMKLLEDFGADGVRYGLMSSAAAGGDILFDEKLCENGRNFCNKLWNALRLVKGWEVAPPSPPTGGSGTSRPNPGENIFELHTTQTKSGAPLPPVGGLGGAKNALAVRWLREKFNAVLAEIEDDFKTFRLSEALLTLYGFIWDDFCSWYLEMIKPGFEQPIDRETYEATLDIFSEMMVALHPFMPFITEELWHQLRERTHGDDCMKQRYPKPSVADNTLIQKVETAKDVIAKIRDLRNQNQLKPREPLTVQVQASDSARTMFAQEGLREMVIKLAVLEELTLTDTEPASAKSFVSGTEKYYVVLHQEIDAAAEREKILKELEHQRSFVRSVEAKLSNERFVSGAPAQVVENERKKRADGLARIQILEESLSKF